ncbi:MAG TPA: alpha/beta hydrolase [Armatimonadota bacterium]|jgi:acetyl esterase/lipase
METDQVRIERDINYAEPEGTPVGLDIFRPEGEGPWPVIMLLHGGGWCVGCRQGLDSFAGMLAADGYLAVTVSYRLAPAFPFPAACDDVSAALCWLVAHAAEYGGDPARIGAYGGSAGAHLVAWLATAPSTPLTCGVAWAGPTDMLREPITYNYRGYTMAFMGTCPHDDPQAYRDASPLLRMTAAMPPLLLIHGASDNVVPPDHARWMAQAAREMGAPVEMLLLDGVGHTGGDPNDPPQAPGWQAMLEFFGRHLGATARVS